MNELAEGSSLLEDWKHGSATLIKGQESNGEH
jgi:hypothetical protein